MSNKILSISLRPQKLEDIIGQDDVVSTVKAQLDSGRVPHFFLISGESGTGKTSVARIIAMMLQYSPSERKMKKDYNTSISKFDIKEINGSDKNGVDDMRELLETINYKPMLPSLAKVIIIDEAHQLTTPAQNALLKITEDSPPAAYFIFCTNNDSKILPTLKRRAFILHTHGIDQPSMQKLLLIAKNKTNYKEDTKELEEELIKYDITSPGLILQAAEKFFGGADVSECIFGTTEGTVDTKKLCNLVSKGDFKNSSVILKTMKKEDIVMVKLCLLGYLKTILLNSGSLKIAKAIKQIGEETYDLSVFLANICLACSIISPKET